LRQLLRGGFAVLAMAVVHFGHVLAAALAAIHAVMSGRLPLLVLGVLRHWIGGSRSSWRLGGQSSRGNQRDHVSSPEFE
jgi:hypothetical protein